MTYVDGIIPLPIRHDVSRGKHLDVAAGGPHGAVHGETTPGRGDWAHCTTVDACTVYIHSMYIDIYKYIDI